MGNLFNPQNPVMRLLSRFFDLIVLNFIFVISCIPVFTIGAAISAMYGVTLKWVDDDDPYVINGFFQAFKNCFKQATLIWLPLLAASVFFVTDLFIIYNVIDPKYNLLQIPVWFFIFIILSMIIYAFPLLSAYENKTKNIIKNAILLSAANFPTTVFFVVIILVLTKIASISSKSLIMVGSLLLFFGNAGFAYFCSLFLIRIFRKCMSDDISDDTPDDKSDISK